MTVRTGPGVPQVRGPFEGTRRSASSSRTSRATPTTSTLQPSSQTASTSSTSKATTVLADAVWRLVPLPGAEDDLAVDQPVVDREDGGHGPDGHRDAAQARPCQSSRHCSATRTSSPSASISTLANLASDALRLEANGPGPPPFGPACREPRRRRP